MTLRMAKSLEYASLSHRIGWGFRLFACLFGLAKFTLLLFNLRLNCESVVYDLVVVFFWRVHLLFRFFSLPNGWNAMETLHFQVDHTDPLAWSAGWLNYYFGKKAVQCTFNRILVAHIRRMWFTTKCVLVKTIWGWCFANEKLWKSGQE